MKNMQAGNLFVCGFNGLKVNDEIKYLIHEKQIAGVILFRRNIESREQLKALTNALQQEAKLAGYTNPLLISIDEECGTVSRLSGLLTPFPGAMLLGATGDKQIVEKVYEALGTELLELGVNWNLAPIADVQNNELNPVIGVRSFGENPSEVGDYVGSAVTGLQKVGAIATLKHFPGHGDTSVDSHLSLPVIEHDEDRLEAIELVPFVKGIEAQAECVMAAHIHFPQFDADQIPASISNKVINGLLRSKLGFKGAVITDCMEMQAIKQSFGTEKACVMGVQAGVDFLLVSHTFETQKSSIKAVEQAIATGEITEQQFTTAYERVQKVIKHVGKVQPRTLDHTAISKQAFDKGVTVIREQEVHFDGSLNIVVLGEAVKTIAEDVVSTNSVLKQSLQNRSYQILTFEQALQAEGSLIVITQNATDSSMQQKQIQQLEAYQKSFVLIATKKPYDAKLTSKMAVCTFEPSVEALAAAFRIICDSQKSHGVLPVTI